MSRQSFVTMLTLALAVSAGGQAPPGTPTFTPTWAVGDYWIVASDRTRWAPVLEASGGEWLARPGGQDRTRFLVTARTADGVELELKYVEADVDQKDECYDAIGYGVRLTIDLRSCRVSRHVSFGFSDDMRPYEHAVAVGPELGPYFELTRHSPYLPAGLEILWPAFAPAEGVASACMGLKAVTVAGDGLAGEAYAQAVTVVDGSIRVAMWSGPGAEIRDADASVPRILVFAPNAPWPDILDDTGHVVNAVVEVGHQP